MRILVISQQYWPEDWRIVDTCEELVRRGNDVTVICGRPNDSRGQLIFGFNFCGFRQESHNGVSILRTADSPRNQGNFSLYLKYRSFVRIAAHCIKHLPDDFSVVLVNGLSPVFQLKPGIIYAKKHGVPMLVYCQDIWPESLSVRGIKDAGLSKIIYRHYLKVSRKLYNSADEILVSSPLFINYLNTVCQVPTEKMSVLVQFAEPVFFSNAAEPVLDSRFHHFVFAGNVGKAQDVETIIKAASLLSAYPNIQIHIVGHGSDLWHVKKVAVSLDVKNVIFHDRVPLEKVLNYYSSADALLLTLSAEPFTSFVLPAKLTAYFASGRPVICACNGAVHDLVETVDCGFSVPSGDSVALSQAILKMSLLSNEDRKRMAGNARQYAKEHFGRDHYYDFLCQHLKSLVK